MKSHRQILITLLIWACSIPAYSSSGGDEKANFEKLSDKLDKAIEERNFQAARETIEELMPLMKEELKRDKKILSEIRKEGSSELDSETFEKRLVRKTELYDSLKKLVDVSPAALRVKSELIRSEVQEFIKLS